MLKIKFKNHKGFTLIELLVVIAILGLQVAGTATALNIAREKSRDAKRKADLKQIYKALNMYLDESSSSGKYPNTNGSFYCFEDDSSGFQSNLVDNTKILVAVPKDKLYTQRATVANGCYAYRSDGNDFKLMSLLEGDSSLMQNDGGATDLRFEIFTPGAKNWFP